MCQWRRESISHCFLIFPCSTFLVSFQLFSCISILYELINYVRCDWTESSQPTTTCRQLSFIADDQFLLVFNFTLWKFENFQSVGWTFERSWKSSLPRVARTILKSTRSKQIVRIIGKVECITDLPNDLKE